jgi:hypothetical protein
LREALLVADHNAYHLGQLVMLRKSIGILGQRSEVRLQRLKSQVRRRYLRKRF